MLSDFGDYSISLSQYVDNIKRCINDYFMLDGIDITVSDVIPRIIERQSIIALLENNSNVRIGQIRYRLNSISEFINAKQIKLIPFNNKLGLEISVPDYFCQYPEYTYK